LCGGFPEILEDGKQGFLVPGGESSEFAAKCLLLCEERELLRKMGSSSRERVRARYSVNVMAERYHDVFCGILRNPGRPDGIPVLHLRGYGLSRLFRISITLWRWCSSATER
jgi:hypothetical protein